MVIRSMFSDCCAEVRNACGDLSGQGYQVFREIVGPFAEKRALGPRHRVRSRQSGMGTPHHEQYVAMAGNNGLFHMLVSFLLWLRMGSDHTFAPFACCNTAKPQGGRMSLAGEISMAGWELGVL